MPCVQISRWIEQFWFCIVFEVLRDFAKSKIVHYLHMINNNKDDMIVKRINI